MSAQTYQKLFRILAHAASCIGLLALTITASLAQLDEPIKPLPVEIKLDRNKVELGERLFHDKRLSKDNSTACSSCHDLSMGGTDQTAVSTGIGGAKGPINAPTVFNSGFNFRQFWDGRASSLEEQIDGPVHHPKEMGTNWPEVIAKLAQDEALVAKFKVTYPNGIQIKNIKDAIATFERSLVTPNAPFDKFLRGDKAALSSDELKGYQLFKNYGCIACHQGVNVGGNMFQVFGVMGDYFVRRGNPTPADLGRFSVTKQETDRHVFKVPSLRNVAETAPYFHDGSAKSLSEAVDVMFMFQLGRPAPDADKALIVRFLRTLTGEYKGKPVGAGN